MAAEPVDILEKLIHGDWNSQVEAIKELPVILPALGPGQTFFFLIPYLAQIASKFDFSLSLPLIQFYSAIFPLLALEKNHWYALGWEVNLKADEDLQIWAAPIGEPLLDQSTWYRVQREMWARRYGVQIPRASYLKTLRSISRFNGTIHLPRFEAMLRRSHTNRWRGLYLRTIHKWIESQRNSDCAESALISAFQQRYYKNKTDSDITNNEVFADTSNEYILSFNRFKSIHDKLKNISFRKYYSNKTIYNTSLNYISKNVTTANNSRGSSLNNLARFHIITQDSTKTQETNKIKSPLPDNDNIKEPQKSPKHDNPHFYQRIHRLCYYKLSKMQFINFHYISSNNISFIKFEKSDNSSNNILKKCSLKTFQKKKLITNLAKSISIKNKKNKMITSFNLSKPINNYSYKLHGFPPLSCSVSWLSNTINGPSGLKLFEVDEVDQSIYSFSTILKRPLKNSYSENSKRGPNCELTFADNLDYTVKSDRLNDIITCDNIKCKNNTIKNHIKYSRNRCKKEGKKQFWKVKNLKNSTLTKQIIFKNKKSKNGKIPKINLKYIKEFPKIKNKLYPIKKNMNSKTNHQLVDIYNTIIDIPTNYNRILFKDIQKRNISIITKRKNLPNNKRFYQVEAPTFVTSITTCLEPTKGKQRLEISRNLILYKQSELYSKRITMNDNNLEYNLAIFNKSYVMALKNVLHTNFNLYKILFYNLGNQECIYLKKLHINIAKINSLLLDFKSTIRDQRFYDKIKFNKVKSTNYKSDLVSYYYFLHFCNLIKKQFIDFQIYSTINETLFFAIGSISNIINSLLEIADFFNSLVFKINTNLNSPSERYIEFFNLHKYEYLFFTGSLNKMFLEQFHIHFLLLQTINIVTYLINKICFKIATISNQHVKYIFSENKFVTLAHVIYDYQLFVEALINQINIKNYSVINNFPVNLKVKDIDKIDSNFYNRSSLSKYKYYIQHHDSLLIKKSLYQNCIETMVKNLIIKNKQTRNSYLNICRSEQQNNISFNNIGKINLNIRKIKYNSKHKTINKIISNTPNILIKHDFKPTNIKTDLIPTNMNHSLHYLTSHGNFQTSKNISLNSTTLTIKPLKNQQIRNSISNYTTNIPKKRLPIIYNNLNKKKCNQNYLKTSLNTKNINLSQKTVRLFKTKNYFYFNEDNHYNHGFNSNITQSFLAYKGMNKNSNNFNLVNNSTKKKTKPLPDISNKISCSHIIPRIKLNDLSYTDTINFADNSSNQYTSLLNIIQATSTIKKDLIPDETITVPISKSQYQKECWIDKDTNALRTPLMQCQCDTTHVLPWDIVQDPAKLVVSQSPFLGCIACTALTHALTPLTRHLTSPYEHMRLHAINCLKSILPLLPFPILSRSLSSLTGLLCHSIPSWRESAISISTSLTSEMLCRGLSNGRTAHYNPHLCLPLDEGVDYLKASSSEYDLSTGDFSDSDYNEYLDYKEGPILFHQAFGHDWQCSQTFPNRLPDDQQFASMLRETETGAVRDMISNEEVYTLGHTERTWELGAKKIPNMRIPSESSNPEDEKASVS